MTTPYAFGAKGDGRSDDTVAVQAWLNAAGTRSGVLEGVRGTFAVAHPLTFIVGAAIVGPGPDAFAIVKHPSFPTDKTMFQVGPLPAIGPGISITGMAIRGLGEHVQPTTSASAVLMEIRTYPWTPNVTKLTLCDVAMSDARWLLAVDGIDLHVERCEFARWGDITVLPEAPSPTAVDGQIPYRGRCKWDGGNAIWIGPSMGRSRILRSDFYDAEWRAILSDGNDVLIDGCSFKRVMESGVFGAGRVVRIVNCNFEDVKRKDCSGHGIEIGGDMVIIANNRFSRMDQTCIYVTDTRYGMVTANICGNPNQEGLPIGPPQEGTTGAITIRAAPGLGQDIDNLTIAGNTCYDTTGKSTHAIVAVNYGGKPARSLHIGPNNTGHAGQWRGSPYSIDPAIKGENFQLIAT